MDDYALALGSVIAVWWVSTGVVLRVVWLPRWTHRYSLVAFSVLALAAVYGVLHASAHATVGGAYLGLASALALWAWHESAFLLGAIAGPRREPERPNASGWLRFRDATATVIHHELALAVTGIALLAMTWDAPNQVATATFVVLWIMRLSAKLNVFVGVPNISEEFVPPHLRYLGTYFRRRRASPLMLVSLASGVAALAWFVDAASAAEASRFSRVANTLVGTMLGLGVLEHVFLAARLPDALLWRWLLRSHSSAQPPSVPTKPASSLSG